MAKMIPNLGSIRDKDITRGERRLGRVLEGLLEDDYTVWYDIPVGRKRRYPDFIILHPGRGLLFLEVKDWHLSTLKSITKVRVELQTSSGLQTDSNPLEQARQCAYEAVNRLRRDPQLVQSDPRYQGKLSVPYSYGVVFTNITRKQWNEAVPEAEQESVLPAHRLICKDEMALTADPEQFQKRLWDMFEHVFGDKLSLPQMDRIRWQLFPEVRINASQASLFDEADEDQGEFGDAAAAMEGRIPDIVRVMDIQQEQLAKSMGDGHRVIHGVAGSGKTLILGYRCMHLAHIVPKPILVLCFNITLAARLRSFIESKGVADKVQVHHFHEWCGQQLKAYNVNLLPGAAPVYERQVESVIQAVDRGQIPRAQYGALMIDEGHDFEQGWLKLVVQMVDPDTNSLLLLYDDAQSIYGKGNLKFPLSSTGIQARGRTTILRLNYRNTREILTFAYEFASDFLKAQDADEDNIPLIAPEVAGINGPAPVYRQFSCARSEADYIGRCISKWQKSGQALNGIAVVYAQHWQAEGIQKALQAADIPCAWLNTQAQKKAYDAEENQVVLLTRQSSKGLEFDTVILAGVGALKDDEAQLAQEARLLYVGMTRAKRHLIVTGSGENWFTERLGKMMGEAA